ncbi:MAG TPA: hypothetical protein VGB07_26795 [Blastocatellia bacterium]
MNFVLRELAGIISAHSASAQVDLPWEIAGNKKPSPAAEPAALSEVMNVKPDAEGEKAAAR